MNKAFVREPDDTLDARCPNCGVIGVAVSRKTVLANVRPGAADGLSDAACFCANPRCGVAYYDALEQSIPVSALLRSLYPKDPTAPVCSCFSVTAEQIESDARAGKPERVRQLIAHAKSPQARCETLAPNGRSCVGEAQQLYIKAGRETKK